MGFFSSPLVILALIILLVGITVILVKLNKKQRQEKNETKNLLLENIQNSIDNVKTLAAEAGLETETIYEAAGISEQEVANLCVYKPPCTPSFKLTPDGCCELKEGEVLTKEQMITRMVEESVKVMAIFITVEQFLEWIARKTGQLLMESTKQKMYRDAVKSLGQDRATAIVAATEKEVMDKIKDNLVKKGLTPAQVEKKLASEAAENIFKTNEVTTNALYRSTLQKEAGGEVSEQFIKNVVRESSEEIIETGVIKSFKKATSSVMSKGVGMAARKVFTSGTKMLSKFLISISSGPLGWAYTTIEVAFAIADIFDPEGYSQFTSRGTIIDMRKAVDYQLENYVKSEGGDWPMIFPLNKVYPKEMEIVTNELPTIFYSEGIEQALNDDPEFTTRFIVNTMIGEENTDEDNEKFNEYINKSVNADPVKRDKIIYEKLKFILPSSDKNKIALYDFLSTEKRVAVSLSKIGVIRWNDDNRQNHLDDEQSLVPIFTDTYYRLNLANPGTTQKPNMVKAPKLREPAPLVGMYNSIFQQCEGELKKGSTLSKKLEKHQPDIDAYKLGVRFDDEDATCIYSEQFCDRMGLKHTKSGGKTDCVTFPGQKNSEYIFGKTLVRGLIRLFD